MIYLDEDFILFFVGISDEVMSLNYFDWGKGGVIDYGVIIDWLVFDCMGVYVLGMGVFLLVDLILSNDVIFISFSLDNVFLVDFDLY